MGSLLLWLSLFWKNFCDCIQLGHQDVWIVSFLKGFPINYLKVFGFYWANVCIFHLKNKQELKDQMKANMLLDTAVKIPFLSTDVMLYPHFREDNNYMGQFILFPRSHRDLCQTEPDLIVSSLWTLFFGLPAAMWKYKDQKVLFLFFFPV